MPFKSKAQRRFFYAAESRGELPRGTAARWEKETPKGKKLPERKKTAAFEQGVQDGLEKVAAQVYTMGSKPSDGQQHWKGKGKEKGKATYGKMRETSTPEITRKKTKPKTKTPDPVAQGKRERRAARRMAGDQPMPPSTSIGGSGGGTKTVLRRRGVKGLVDKLKGMSGKKKAGIAAAALLATGGTVAAVEKASRPN